MLSLSPGPSVHVSPLVEATRRTPASSDIANWPIRLPGTSPVDAYSVAPARGRSDGSGLAWGLDGPWSNPARDPADGVETPSLGGAIFIVAT